jgi:hypothetical protein|tara:strand:- start:413 stop:658 length:246 start_codon:yes stop_codon:yes gene_type:complete
MIKRLNFGLVIMLAMVLIVSCAPKPAPAPEEPIEADVPAETGEASIDEVAADISDAADIDEELDTSGLDDVEDILADIENI